MSDEFNFSGGESENLEYSDVNLSQEIAEYQENSTKTQFDVLKRDAVAALQRKAMAQVTAVLGEAFPLTYARQLLEAYKWDELKALNAYTENPERLSAQLGFAAPDTAGAAAGSSCSICYDDDVDRASLVALWCGHTFCGDCWRGYLALKVKEKATHITCPGADAKKKKCTLLVDDVTIAKLLGDEASLQRHAEALVDSYVQVRSDLRHCVQPNCSNIVRLVSRATGVFGSDETTCACGATFCFGCGELPHRPASCNMLVEWKKKSGGGDEDVSVQLIATVSRPCPSCKAPIIKNDGCHHMTCASCSYHFCWHCNGKFGSGPKGGTDGYSSHKCNGLFQADKDTLALQNEFQVFTHYNDRYLNHAKSREFVKQGLASSEALVQQIMAAGAYTYRHAQFIVRAFEQDMINRTTIMMSYVFGYYRARHCPQVNKDIFENLQGALERHTEILTASVSKKSVAQLIVDESVILNATRSAANVRAALLDAASSWDDKSEHRPSSSSSLEPQNKRPKTSLLAGIKQAVGLSRPHRPAPVPVVVAAARAPAQRAPVTAAATDDDDDADDIAAAAAVDDDGFEAIPPELMDEMASDMTPEEIELRIALAESLRDTAPQTVTAAVAAASSGGSAAAAPPVDDKKKKKKSSSSTTSPAAATAAATATATGTRATTRSSKKK